MVKKSRGKASRRPTKPLGQLPVIAGRVPAALHRQIKQAAAQSGHSMSEELAALAARSLGHLGLTEEILALGFGAELGRGFAMAHVYGGVLQLNPGDRERLRAKAYAKIDEILNSIPEKPEVQS